MKYTGLIYCFIMLKINPPLHPFFVLKIPFIIQFYQQRRGENGESRVQNHLRSLLRSVHSFLQEITSLLPHRLGSMCNAGITRCTWFLSRKIQPRLCFLFLPHLLPPSLARQQLPVGRQRTHRSSENPRAVVQQDKHFNQLQSLLLPFSSSSSPLSSVPISWH